MNEVLDALRVEDKKEELNKLFPLLMDEITRHFHEEEAILRALDWPWVERHSHIHWKLERSVWGMYASWQAKQIDLQRFVSFIIHDIIVNHILEDDTLFFDAISKRSI